MKRTLAILLILSFLLSLTACAPADTPAGTTAAATRTIPTVSPGKDFSTDEEYHYVAERRDSPEWMSGDRAVAAGNGRFWQLASRTDTDDHSSFIASLRTSGGGFERHPYKVEDHHILSALAPIPGEHYCLWFIESVHIPGTPGRNHYGPHNIVRINADGEVVASADITALIGERDISRSVGVALTDGRFFLCVEDLVCLFDGEGELILQTNADPSTGFPEAALTFSGTITLLLDVNGARQLYLLNETTQRIESLGQVNENNADIHLAAGDAFFDLYLFDKDLCGYSLTTGQKRNC